MEYQELFLQYTKEHYKDIAFIENKDVLFPDIATGYSQVRIVYNKAYHSLDLKFNGMGEYEQLFGNYVYPILMKHRDYSIWKMASSRVVRVKVPCINEELGFIEEDCDEQMECVRTLIDILSKINVAEMYSVQRSKREKTFKTDSQVEAETEMFIADFEIMLDDRNKEIAGVGTDLLGKKGILNRFSNMEKDLDGFIFAHQQFIDRNPELLCNKKVLEFKNSIASKLGEL